MRGKASICSLFEYTEEGGENSSKTPKMLSELIMLAWTASTHLHRLNIGDESYVKRPPWGCQR